MVTVREVQAQVPLAEVYELKPECRYLIVVDKGTMSDVVMEGLSKSLKRMGIQYVILSSIASVRVLELIPESENGNS